MATTSAAEIIRKYQTAALEEVGEQPPALIATEIVLLAAKIHEAASLTLVAEQRFAARWMDMRTELKTDGQCDKRAKSTTEYADLHKARTNEKTVLELIRSLKKLLASKSEEARNQY